MAIPDRNKAGEFLALVTPYAWTDPTAAEVFIQYGDVEIQVIGTPGTAYVPTRSLDGTTFVACNAYDKDGTVVTSISTAGIYTLKGGGHLKFSAGAGSTIFVRAGS